MTSLVPLNGLSYSRPNNRRNDLIVRSAIDDIQDLLFDPQASSKILDVLLKHFVDITDSDYGTSFVADADALLPIDTDLLGSLHCIHANKSTLSHWVTQKVLPLRPVFYNKPIPKSHKTLLIAPEQVAAIMILPVISQNKLRSICILGKRNSDYNGEMARRLMPLLGSVVCALQSADSVKGNFLGLDKKISDNRYLSSLLSSSPIAVIVVAPDKTILTSNPVAQEIFNVAKAKRAETNLPTALAGTLIDNLLPNYNDLFKWSNQKSRYGQDKIADHTRLWEDQKAYRMDGSSFLVSLTIFRYTHGNQRFTTLQIQDITAIRESAEKYQETSQQLSALTHLVPVGIVRVDANWNCLYANDKWYEFSGLISEESMGQLWINAIHSDDIKVVLDEIRDALQFGRDYQKELRLVSPLGQTLWVDFNMRVLFNESGGVDGFLGAFADITEYLIHQEKLRHVAEYDMLTGLELTVIYFKIVCSKHFMPQSEIIPA